MSVKHLRSRRWILASLLIALLATLPSCGPKKADADARKSPIAEAPATPATPKLPPLRVLFVGNNYTFDNGGIPAALTAMAQAKDDREILAVSSVAGGKTLQWHWEQGTARESIAHRGPWDYVVLQDFRTRPVNDPSAMFAYVRKFDELIRDAGAKTVLFMTWAKFNQPENEVVIAQAYDKIGRELGATVARVGPAWERVLDERPSIKLHMEDRSHPTPAGTYLAACVFYATLLNDSPVGLPARLQLANGKVLEVAPEDAKVLQKAAERVARVSPAD
jgi:hypothetical protein